MTMFCCARLVRSGTVCSLCRGGASALSRVYSSQLARCLQYLGNMPRHLHIAPLSAQYAFAIDQKGAAFNTFIVFAVQLFLADHIEQTAQSLVGVADQFKGKALFGPEVLMGAQAVP